MFEFYVGIDVHQQTSSYCILNQLGKVVKEKNVRGSWHLLLLELAEIRGKWAAAFEASCGYGVLHDKLVELGAHVIVAHPGELRLIFKSKRKNDRVDAKKIATLLFLDQIPRVWVPQPPTREWRQLIEYRQTLVAKRTRTKNQLRALFRAAGIPKISRLPGGPKAQKQMSSLPPEEVGARSNAVASCKKVRGKGVWSTRGLQILAALDVGSSAARLCRDQLLEELENCGEHLLRVEKELDMIAARHPGIALLRSIPGVGPRTSEAALAYIDDPYRFRQNKQVGAYAGLVPCQDASAGVNRLGHITREGPGTLRWLLVEAAWQGIRHSPTIKAFYNRVRQGRKDRGKLALVATGHYLLRVMLAMLKSGEVWREEVPRQERTIKSVESAKAEVV